MDSRSVNQQTITMVEIIGSLQETVSEEGQLRDTWRMPSLSEGLAKRQARTNARVKGRTDPEIVSVTEIAQGDLPGQSIYRVETRSAR